MDTQTTPSLRGLQAGFEYLVDAETKDDERTFVNERFGLFVFLVAVSIASILITGMIVREFYWRKFGIDICSCAHPLHRPRRVAEQIDQDRAMAVELQRQLQEEEGEEARRVKRKERWAWYESYIQPFTFTAEKKDLFYAQETEDGNITEIRPEEQKRFRRMSSAESTDDEAEEEEDPELGSDESDSEKPTICCDQHDDNARLCLRLPAESCKKGKRMGRSVDAHCAVCFCEYEEGEKVVWSELECKHAFHYECMMPWLSKGKKRCPICRHWFVPGAKIDDQKTALEQRLRLESSSSVTVSDTASSDESNSNDETSSNASEIHAATECVETSGQEEEQAPTTLSGDHLVQEQAHAPDVPEQQNNTETKVDDQSLV